MFRKLPESPRPDATIAVDGASVACQTGETVAAVLLRMEGVYARNTNGRGVRRGPFCLMGVCFDCLIELEDGVTRRSCATFVEAGMVVRRHQAKQLVES